MKVKQESKQQFSKCWPPKDITSDTKKEVRQEKTVMAEGLQTALGEALIPSFLSLSSWRKWRRYQEAQREGTFGNPSWPKVPATTIQMDLIL